jgi:uncharacterized membrane protein YgdD (TMEM256/DUF423 family)
VTASVATGHPARWALVWGALFGLTGVAAGAFGAHGLRDRVDAGALEIWRTAAHYQQIHAVALVAIGLFGAGASGSPRRERALRAAAVLWIAGVLVFAGTLYAMVLGGPRMLGAITPVGGLALMAGWLALLAGALRRERAAA